MVSWALSVTKGLQENMLCTCHVYRHMMSHLFASQTEKWCCKNDIAVEKHEMGSMELLPYTHWLKVKVFVLHSPSLAPAALREAVGGHSGCSAAQSSHSPSVTELC